MGLRARSARLTGAAFGTGQPSSVSRLPYPSSRLLYSVSFLPASSFSLLTSHSARSAVAGSIDSARRMGT